MKEHVKTFWGHLPPSIQHIVKSAFAGAGIGMLTAVFAETMKQAGVQTPPMPGQPGSPGPQPSGQPNGSQSWAGRTHYTHRHHSHHWKGRS